MWDFQLQAYLYIFKKMIRELLQVTYKMPVKCVVTYHAVFYCWFYKLTAVL